MGGHRSTAAGPRQKVNQDECADGLAGGRTLEAGDPRLATGDLLSPVPWFHRPMSSDTRTSAHLDWLVPTLLIVAAVVFGLVAWLIYNATDDDASEQGLVGQLEAYTRCLNDHGANVPLVESRSDGGFAVIVPGSLAEGQVDIARWIEARDACRSVEPDLFGLVFGAEGLNLGDLSPMLLPGLLDGGSLFEDDPRRPGGGFFDEHGPRGDQFFGDRGGPLPAIPRDAGLGELCERLEAGIHPPGIDLDSLRELCELMGARTDR